MKRILVFGFLLFTIYYLLSTASFAQETPPELEIRTPADGEAYDVGESIKLSIKTSNFLFVDFKSNREPFPGNSNAGHAHLWIVPAGFEGELEHDVAKKLLDGFRPVEVAVEGPGKYRAVVELTQNDHTRYDPPVRDEIVFVVGDVALGSEINEALFSGDTVYSKAAFGLFGLIVLLVAVKVFLHFKKRTNKTDSKNTEYVDENKEGSGSTAQHSIPDK